MGRSFQTRLAFVFLLLLTVGAKPLSAQENTEQRDSLVRLMKGSSVSLVEEYGRKYRKAIDATFLHNGTYLICDTALWDVDNKIINAYGNVQIIQEETILTSQKLDYIIDENLAQFRGGIVQLQNKENNTLRTKHLDYNTKDSLAIFQGGAAMRDQDGQIIESLDGTYSTPSKEFCFRNQVEMFSDSVFIKTNLLYYHSNQNLARFPEEIDFWKEGNMLSSNSGWYNRGVETFFFQDEVHAQGETQEAWTDSLYYYRALNDLEMRGNTQMQDWERNTASLSKYVYYTDSSSMVTLKNDAAVAIFTDENNRKDTLYVGANELRYWTVPLCNISQEDQDAAKGRHDGMFVDPVGEYRLKAAQAAKAAAEQAAAQAAENDPALAAQRKAQEMQAARSLSPEAKAPIAEDNAPASEGEAPVPEMPQEEPQSETAAADTVEGSQEEVAVDSTKMGFVLGLGNVKVFRKDIQAKCDSLLYNDIDSIARLYINPVVWNDGNRQYNSDSLFVLVKDGGIDRANLMSNAFIMVQEDSLAFDQIRGTEAMAYFDSTSALKRFDALGGASAIFYLEENGSLVTVNKVSSKMLSANLVDGNLDRVYYFESPQNDAYPRAQFEGDESRMKGFDWLPELKPKGKEDITTLTLRPSEKDEYLSRPRPRYKQTAIYFPGYMDRIYREIAVRDSLNNIPAPAPEASQDTTLNIIPKGGIPLDSLDVNQRFELTDSTTALDAPAVKDSTALASAVDSATIAPAGVVSAVADTALVEEAVLSAAAIKKAQREAELQEKIDERDAKWARLDSLDSLKLVEKNLKITQKKREKTRKALLKKWEQDSKDQAKLEKYIKLYERKKAKEDRRRSRRSNSVLSGNGSADDRNLLRSRSLPGPESRTSL